MRKKVLIMFFILAILTVFINTNVFAFDLDNIVTNKFNTNSTNNGVTEGRDVATKLLANIIVTVQAIGSGVAIIMLIALGLKYITGSIEEKVEVKKHATVYVVGALVFFGAAGILQIVQEFIKGNFKVG